MYKWTIVEESLQDNRLLNELKITSIRISNDENPETRWHIYNIYLSYEDILELAKKIKLGWYMHFWLDREVIVVFENKVFELNYDDKDSWYDTVQYWLSVGISLEQLDFIID